MDNHQTFGSVHPQGVLWRDFVAVGHKAVVSGFMVATLVAYTVFLGLFLPSTWLEPFGGLIKNIPLIPAVLVMAVLSKKR